MQIKAQCKCGSEFYMSTADEDHETLDFVHRRYNTFVKWHGKCMMEANHFTTQDKEEEVLLPEDWKV